MRVHLTRKLAESIDGVDLSTHREGDTFDLAERDAQLLIAEQWATPAGSRTQEVRESSLSLPCADAGDKTVARVRRLPEQLDGGQVESQPHRRAEGRGAGRTPRTT
jgi:hypothetical protein